MLALEISTDEERWQLRSPKCYGVDISSEVVFTGMNSVN